MPLGKKVGLGPGDIVLDGAPLKKGNSSTYFRPMFIMAKQSPISAVAELLLMVDYNTTSILLFIPTTVACKMMTSFDLNCWTALLMYGAKLLVA